MRSKMQISYHTELHNYNLKVWRHPQRLVRTIELVESFISCVSTIPGVLPLSCLSLALCSRTSLFFTGEGSRVSCAAGGIKPLSIRLSIPFLASSSLIGGGANYKVMYTDSYDNWLK